MAGVFAGRPIFKPLGTLALLTVTGLATLLGGFYSSGNSTVGGSLTVQSLYATSTGSPSVYASGTSIFTNLTVTGACTGCGGGSLSGGIADSLTFWNSGSAVSASTSLTYSSSTGLLSNLGSVSSTNITVNSLTRLGTASTSAALTRFEGLGSGSFDGFPALAYFFPSNSSVWANYFENKSAPTGTGWGMYVGNNGDFHIAPSSSTFVDAMAFYHTEAPIKNSVVIGTFASYNPTNTLEVLGTASSSAVHAGVGSASTTLSHNGNILTSGTYLPATNNAQDIGAFGSAIRDFYASGTVRASSTQMGNGTNSFPSYTFASDRTSGMHLVSTGVVDLDANGVTRLRVNDGTNIQVTVPVVPSTNNAIDIGAFATAFKDIYSSGTTRLGTLSNDGNTTLGDTSGDTVTYNALVASNISPNANNTFDLGAFGTAWKDVYSSGTARLSAVTVTTSVNPVTNNVVDLGTFGTAFRNINASGTLQIGGNMTLGDNATVDTLTVNARYASTIQPTSNNVRALGAFGFAWSNIFASGTIFVNNVSSSNITASSLAATAAGDVNLCISTTGVFTSGATCGTSSGYYKEHIVSMNKEEALRKFMQLRSVTYDYKTGMGANDEKKQSGYIAEEFANIDPTFVMWAEPTPEHLAWTEANWPSLVKTVNGKTIVPNGVLYDRVNVLITAATQFYMEKTDARIDALTARIDKQESLITKLFKLIEKILTKLHI